MIKRVVTIEMNIDETTHRCSIITTIRENGKLKKDWTHTQLLSTVYGIIGSGHDLLGQYNNDLIKAEDDKVQNSGNNEAQGIQE